MVDLRPGQPMIYGKNGEKGIAYDCGEPKSVLAGEASIWKADTPTPAPAMVVAEMDLYPDLPRAIGIFRSIEEPVYDQNTRRQVEEAERDGTPADLKNLIYTKDAWEVK
jgi:2-oxoglutarate ferredoxin oxidoreductase subunit beta